jgi:hypothetical protein
MTSERQPELSPEQERGCRQVYEKFSRAFVMDFRSSGPKIDIPTGEFLLPKNGCRSCFGTLLAIAAVLLTLFLVHICRYDHDLYAA